MTGHVIRLDGSPVGDRAEIGNKAYSLAGMRSLGLPVPPAFVLPVAVGRRFCASGELPDDVWEAMLAALADMESEIGRTLGHPDDPLLVSVRSGAAESMPGMMDTILDLGVNDAAEVGLARVAGDAAFARDTHRRFVESYARCVLGVKPPAVDDPIDLRKAVEEMAGTRVPQDPHEQLRAAVVAVLGSWNSRRARAYREHHGLSHDGGTAVTVQAMVFGNLDERSGTGVLFTRDPQSGEPRPMGEFLPRGQGEDVVSGEVDPVDLSGIADWLPDVATALREAGERLEREAGDVQDIEFTVERGALYLLQTRTAKRSGRAAIRIASDMASEGAITRAEALRRVKPEHVHAVLRPVLDGVEGATRLATGIAACPGIASGIAVGDPDDAVDSSDEHDVVLVRRATSPDDVHGMMASVAVCTEIGGRTSHAAVVGRELGLPSVVGCGEGTLAGLAGREITVDGTTGEIWAGRLPVHEPDPSDVPGLATLVEWAAASPDVVPADHPLCAVARPGGGETR